MKRFLDIIANALSILFYPLFIPTYGISLFCYSYASLNYTITPVWIAVAIGGTLLLTCILPATAIMILIRQGRVKNMQIENAAERTMPYVYATLGFGFWCYLLMAILHTPLYINVVAIGATVAIGIVTLINRYWKISAHLTAAGGLFGGLMSYCLGVGAIPTWGTIGLWLGLILCLMYARLWLNAHTPAQVICGLLMGICCTYLPTLIVLHAA